MNKFEIFSSSDKCCINITAKPKIKVFDNLFPNNRQFYYMLILFRYHLYIDCMPTCNIVNIDNESMNRILKWAQGPKSLSNDAR